MTAAEYINQSFNGHTGFKDSDGCAACGQGDAVKKCTACESPFQGFVWIFHPFHCVFSGKCVQYCDQECQKLHWFAHKAHCKRQ